MPVSSSTSRSAADLEGLPDLELSLGERPVLLHRPVHDRRSRRRPPCRRTTSPPAAWTTSVWEGSSAVIARRATASQVTAAPPPIRGNQRRSGNESGARCSVTAMSESKETSRPSTIRSRSSGNSTPSTCGPWSGGWPPCPPSPSRPTTAGPSPRSPARRGGWSTPISTRDDWRIARAGFVVRTRRRGRHDEVTLKDSRPAEGSGLRQRLEVTEVLSAVRSRRARAPTARSAAGCAPSSARVDSTRCSRSAPAGAPSRCESVASTWPRSRSTTP